MNFNYAQTWLLGIFCFIYGIYRIIGEIDKSFNWIDILAIIGVCYSIYVIKLRVSK